MPSRTEGKLWAKQERRFIREHPFERFEWRITVGPRLAIAHRDLRGIGKAGFAGRLRLTIDHHDLMPGLQQMPRRTDTDDACAENDNFHSLHLAST